MRRVLERDPAKRAEMYQDLQQQAQDTSPFVIMFQQIEVLGLRDNVEGFIIGPNFDDNSFRDVTKNGMSVSPARTREGRRRRPSSARPARRGKLVVTVAITFLGLLVVTFLIGRVVPIDPVLAVVGDRASKSTYDAAYIELGLDKPL